MNFLSCSDRCVIGTIATIPAASRMRNKVARAVCIVVVSAWTVRFVRKVHVLTIAWFPTPIARWHVVATGLGMTLAPIENGDHLGAFIAVPIGQAVLLVARNVRHWKLPPECQIAHNEPTTDHLHHELQQLQTRREKRAREPMNLLVRRCRRHDRSMVRFRIQVL